MVASYYGHKVDLNALRRNASTARGATLRDLTKYAASLQLISRALRLDLGALPKLQCPAVLHWDMNHFVVLAKATSRKLTIHDPALGRRQLRMDEASRHFTGVALELTPSAEFKPVDETHKLRITDLWSASRGLGTGLMQLLLLSVVLQIFAIAAPFYTQLVVDEALVKQDKNLLIVLAVGFLFITLLQVAVTALRGYASLYFSNSIGFQISANLFRHMIRLPLEYFERRHMGDLVSRFGSLDAVRSLLTDGIVSAVLDGLMSVACVLMMWVYSPTLTVIVVVSFLAFLSFRLLSIRGERTRMDEQITARARQHSIFMESARAILSIKSFGRENERESVWHNAFADEINSGIRLERFAVAVGGVNGLLSGIESIAVIYVAGTLVLGNSMTVGMLFAFISYKQTFARAMQSFTNTIVHFKTLDLHLTRIADMAFATRELGFEPAPAQLPPLHGRFALHDVSYRYASNEPLILSAASFVTAPGECVSLVGPSGCGKSTLMKLMMGLLQPSTGRVLIDGRPLAEFGLQSFRAQTGAVLQGDVLLSGSIAENIAFFSHEQNMQRVMESAFMACVHDEIMAMPMKYETQVGDMGAKMSYGQRQRVLIARAIYSAPKLLFMDEATSHIDLTSERTILANLKSMGVTLVVISHRPEILDLADRVVAVTEASVATLRPREPAVAPRVQRAVGAFGGTLSDGTPRA
jgi:ATP-binding cassette, subfamily B, bacterial CvaB/MchF/RaxB